MNSEAFEQEYVHKFYSQKSKKFSDSRVVPWPFTRYFIENHLNPTDLVLDAGCGNGRQFLHQNTIGVDKSPSLLQLAARKPHLCLINADIHILPFRDCLFDAVLSIAVIHHLSTHKRRLNSLMEIKRVLKVGGLCLLYVWHKDAAKKTKFRLLDSNDEYLVSWKGEEDLLRYYHLFDEESLRAIVNEAGFILDKICREQESLYAMIRKDCN